MGRKVTIIDGHPDPGEGRLCHALARAYEKGAREAGHEVSVIVVADLDFPVLRARDEFEDGAVAPDVVAAQESIAWAEHIVVVYPLWLGTMPALLKAFLEQTMRPGFAFEKSEKGWPKQRLAGRSARIVVTMGMPAFWYRWFFRAHSLKSLERNILKFCGIKPVRETIFGMVEAADERRRAKWLDKMATLGRRAA